MVKSAWNPKRKAFSAAFDSDDLDASALLLAELGLVAPDDPRFVSTVEAIGHELRRGFNVMRYVAADDFGCRQSGIEKKQCGNAQCACTHRRECHEHPQHETCSKGQRPDPALTPGPGRGAAPVLDSLLAEDRQRGQDQRHAEALGHDARERRVIDPGDAQDANGEQGAGKAAAGKPADSYLAYVGTYTTGESKGIYAFDFDPATGQLKPKGIAAETPDPSWVVVHPNAKYAYAANEAGKASTVSAFAVDAKSGMLTQLNQKPALGEDPCYLSFDGTGRFLLLPTTVQARSPFSRFWRTDGLENTRRS